MNKWHKILLITVSLLLAMTVVIEAHVPYIEHQALRHWGSLAEGEDYSFEHPFIIPDGLIQQSRAVFAYLSKRDRVMMFLLLRTDIYAILHTQI